MKQLHLIVLSAFISMAALAQLPKNLESELVLRNVKTGKETVVLREKRRFEAPNWSCNGKLKRVSLN